MNVSGKNDVICKFPKDQAQKKLVLYPAEPGCWHIDWSQRCGAHSCIADTANTGDLARIDLLAEDTDEIELQKEQEKYGDIFRVDTVDECALPPSLVPTSLLYTNMFPCISTYFFSC